MTTVQERLVARTFRPPALLVLPLVAGAGAAAAADGRRAGAILVFAALMMWGQHEARSTSSRRRLGGHALTLIGMGTVIALTLPDVLPQPADHLLVVSLTSLPLLWVCVAAPTVRRELRLSRPTGLDLALVVGGFCVAGALGLGVAEPQATAHRLDLLAMTVLVVVLPVVDEALYRGLLMRAVGDSAAGVLSVAAVQGLVAGAAFGAVALLLTFVLGVALGLVRQATGRWQSSLSLHWGIALGLAVPLLTVQVVLP